MADLTLCANAMSRGRTARRMPGKTGQPGPLVILAPGTTMKAPRYPAFNPMGRVPALRQGDVTAMQCAAAISDRAFTFHASALCHDGRGPRSVGRTVPGARCPSGPPDRLVPADPALDACAERVFARPAPLRSRARGIDDVPIPPNRSDPWPAPNA